MTLLEILKRQRTALIARDDDALARLEAAYTGVADELNARIAALEQRFDEALAEKRPIKLSWVYQQERYQALLEQAKARAEEFAPVATQITIGQQQAGILAAGLNLQEHLNELNLAGTFSQLPSGALDTLVGFLADGSPITAHFAKMPGVLVAELQSTLTQGIAAGDSPRTLAYELRKKAKLPLDSALRTARTEHLRSYNNASLENYRQNSNVVTGWQWLATLGGRTCPYCLAKHGTIHSLDEPFVSHVSCRCTPTPVTRSGPPITTDGDIWLAQQEPAEQDAILGKAAAAEWRAGKLRLEDFAGTKERGDWGEQGYVRSLKEAQGAAAKRRTMPSTDPDPYLKSSGPRDPALPSVETREQMGKRLQSEAEALLPKITELVGLPSRWNQQEIEIGDANEPWRGKKNLSCSISIREIEADRYARWRTLIHELLHGHSPIYSQVTYTEHRPWEEAVVEQIQRLIRGEVLAAARIEVPENVLEELDSLFEYNRHIESLEKLRQLTDKPAREFWVELLQTPIKLRAGYALGLSGGLVAEARTEYVRQLSLTRAIMQKRER
jgi:SPP1 gp7 family putative phage head morphogenesis protein